MTALYGWLLIAGIVAAVYLYFGRPWFTWLHPGELAGLWSYPLVSRARRRRFRGLMNERKEADFGRRVAAVTAKPPRRPALRPGWHVSAKFSLHASGSFELGRPPAPEREVFQAAPPGVDGRSWDGRVPSFGTLHTCDRGNYLNQANCPKHGTRVQVSTGREGRGRARSLFRLRSSRQAEADDVDLLHQDLARLEESAAEVHQAVADLSRRVASGELGERYLPDWPGALAYFDLFPEDRPRNVRKPGVKND